MPAVMCPSASRTGALWRDSVLRALEEVDAMRRARQRLPVKGLDAVEAGVARRESGQLAQRASDLDPAGGCRRCAECHRPARGSAALDRRGPPRPWECCAPASRRDRRAASFPSRRGTRRRRRPPGRRRAAPAGPWLRPRSLRAGRRLGARAGGRRTGASASRPADRRPRVHARAPGGPQHGVDERLPIVGSQLGLAIAHGPSRLHGGSR